jgi:hypothetical protein
LLLKLIDGLFHLPYLTFSSAKILLSVTFRSAQLNVLKLVAAGILLEVPGRKYDRIFIAREIVDILEAPEPSDSDQRRNPNQ